MSVIRFVNDRNRRPDQLRRIIRYVTREEAGGQSYTYGQGIDPDAVLEEMTFSKRIFHQESGKQYQHLVVSFDQMLRQPEIASQIGKELAQFYKEYQVLIVTHLNTANLHCHLVINTVNMNTGKKLSQGKKEFYNFLEFSNKVFERHNLPRIGAKQLYQLVIDENYDYEDDEFDDIIYERLNELYQKWNIERPIEFTDKEVEQKDRVKSIFRMEERERTRR